MTDYQSAEYKKIFGDDCGCDDRKEYLNNISRNGDKMEETK